MIGADRRDKAVVEATRRGMRAWRLIRLVGPMSLRKNWSPETCVEIMHRIVTGKLTSLTAEN